MNVSELIKDTIWTQGRAYAIAQPIISVLLPTFRRGEDGLLRKVIQSILFQTFENIELIIVDDASTDGTANVIKEAMAADPRVSCLTHPRNIGLPAVSEYEAFVRSRGKYIAFAFDDFIFEENAFNLLHDFSSNNGDVAVHGFIKWTGSDGIVRTLGQEISSYDRLTSTNFIGNSSILLPRNIIEDVGLYDPHVGLSRVCDWDLWRRVHRKYPIKFINHLIGEEFGASRSDSLGNTYPMRFEVVQELMSLDRDEQLRPHNFHERDVLFTDHSFSFPLSNHLIECFGHFANKFWFDKNKNTSFINAIINNPVIGIFGEYDTSTSLMFDGLPDVYKSRLNFIEPVGHSEYLDAMVSRCDAIIIVRHLLQPQYLDIAQICDKNSIPIYWLIDDNFEILSTCEPQLAAYTRNNIRHHLRNFHGVLVSTVSLGKYAQDSKWHSNVELFSAIFSQSINNKYSSERAKHIIKDKEFRAAFFGGGFRKQRFVETVLPELSKLDCSIKIMVRGNASEYPSEYKNIQLIDGGVSNYSSEFLDRWSEFQPHIVLHPKGDSPNIQYKTANAVLQSLYLGALPIVEDEEAYNKLDLGILRLDAGNENWYEVVKMLQNSNYRDRLLQDLRKKIPLYFSNKFNIKAIDNITIPLSTDNWIRYTKRLRGQMMATHTRYQSDISALRSTIWDEAVKVGWEAAAEAVGADYQRQISDYKRQIADCKYQIADQQSKINEYLEQKSSNDKSNKKKPFSWKQFFNF